MNTQQASKLFEALSSPARLAAFQMLVQAGSSGMNAGDLAKALSLAPNNLSFHLKTLSQTNLVYSEQDGRFIRYYANLGLMVELVSFLTANCCQNGNDEKCKQFCG